MNHSVDEIKMINLKQKTDPRGSLVVAECLRDIPFEVKRLFYIYGVSGNESRGNHANRESEFVMIAVHGKCRVKAIDANGDCVEYKLNDPSKGLYLPTMIWKEMYDFSEDAVLLILANTYYLPDEYIKNLEDLK